MYEKALEIITRATHVVVIQGENPDGDSLASSLALEELLAEQDKKVTLYCAITMPKYLRYIQGGDRVVNDFPYDADVAIIVDTAAEALVEKALATPGVRHFLESHPVVVLDHHGENDEDASMNDLSFTHEFVMSATAASTGEVIYELARVANWQVSAAAAEQLYISIASDTLGLTTQSTTATTYQIVADLVKAGAVPAEIELRRREFMKKPADILAYNCLLYTSRCV